jgi:hypothetical protein
MNKVQYLRYIVDEHGVHVDPAKIQVIHDWPTPTTLTKLQSFLGLANFYHRFVLGFSHITWALSQVTKGGCKAKFVWGRSQQKYFDDLKHRLCSSPVLTLPNLQQPFEIETMLLIMLLVSFSLNMVIQWPIIVRHSQMSSISTPPMTNKCIPSYNPVHQWSITF